MTLLLGVAGILCGAVGIYAVLELVTLPVGTPRAISLEKGRRLALSLGAASALLSGYSLTQRWWFGAVGCALGVCSLLFAVLLAPQ